MIQSDVVRIVKGVLLDAALPFALLDVTGAGERWVVTVRYTTGRVLHLDVAAMTAPVLRGKIKELLEAELS